MGSYALRGACLSVPPSLAPVPCSLAAPCPPPPMVPEGAATLTPSPYQVSFSLQSKDSEIKKAGSDGEGPHPPHPAGHTRGGHGQGPLGLPAVGPTTSFPPPCWVLVALGGPQHAHGWWLVLAGDIVDSSADSPPSLKARTHSVSTGGSPVGAGGGHTSPLGRGLCHLCWHQATLQGGPAPPGTGGHGQGPLPPWVPNPGHGRC